MHEEFNTSVRRLGLRSSVITITTHTDASPAVCCWLIALKLEVLDWHGMAGHRRVIIHRAEFSVTEKGLSEIKKSKLVKGLVCLIHPHDGSPNVRTHNCKMTIWFCWQVCVTWTTIYSTLQLLWVYSILSTCQFSAMSCVR